MINMVKLRQQLRLKIADHISFLEKCTRETLRVEQPRLQEGFLDYLDGMTILGGCLEGAAELEKELKIFWCEYCCEVKDVCLKVRRGV